MLDIQLETNRDFVDFGGWGGSVHKSEAEKALELLRWLRVRVHLYQLLPHDEKGATCEAYQIYCRTDRLDPWPGVRYGTAGWELMTSLSRRYWTAQHELTARAVAACYLQAHGLMPRYC